MKEVTYEDWQRNPNPREMWVWDNSEEEKRKRRVIYISKEAYPVVSLTIGDDHVEHYGHCAEIKELRLMTNKELLRWLTEKPHREIKDAGWIFSRYYYIAENKFQEVKDDIFIREDGGEWREPLLEVEE